MFVSLLLEFFTQILQSKITIVSSLLLSSVIVESLAFQVEPALYFLVLPAEVKYSYSYSVSNDDNCIRLHARAEEMNIMKKSWEDQEMKRHIT